MGIGIDIPFPAAPLNPGHLRMEAVADLLGPVLKAVSRSFYLSLRFLPSGVREPLGLAYLLARASDTVADTAAAPLQLRIQALDAFQQALSPTSIPPNGSAPHPASNVHALFSELKCPHPGEARLLHQIAPLLQAYAALPPPLQTETHRVLTTIIQAQRGDLLRFGYASVDAPQCLPTAADTIAYTYAVAGCVGEFWTTLCALQIQRFTLRPYSELLQLGREFGQGLQLVNILRDLPADLQAGRCYLPADELFAENLHPAEILSHPEKLRPVVLRWINQAEEWLQSGACYVQGVRGLRVRFSVALPRRIGEETLLLLKQQAAENLLQKARVTRSTVFYCAAQSMLEGACQNPDRPCTGGRLS